ncbi:hypothetical protein RDG65_000921 [Vibrio fluvialis]|uniref:Uncharacterized protein n=1 Tax=Vibrio fluvialis PG41 TaxID=1336752 RepID=S7JHD7_VIBFL|nr:hypothetical protein [Vibrio fluvialis]ELE5025662.1 hypothetical protein [Vibrio fluvialis]EPP23491.1 hypothetical protein L910_4052 [Vibrio fluvialis PG41]MBY8314955.1 hypothetical protein [Vibrio fluvialis]
MAPRLPKQVDAEIYDLLNGSIRTGIAIPEIQFRGLIRKAEKLPAPFRYACLSALYSHSLDYERAIENAVYSVKYGCDEQFCVENALSALSNNKLFADIVKLSKEFPVLLNYSDSRNESYDAATYIFDLDYCEYIADNFELKQDNPLYDYEAFRCYLDNDRELIKKASDYMIHVFDGLTKLLKLANIRTKSFGFGMVSDSVSQYIEVNVSLHNTSIEQAVDLELSWHEHIAKFDVSEAQLCNMAFVIEAAE